jgi:tRNA nucleotidyltransferase (CCA-adding enzyme)
MNNQFLTAIRVLEIIDNMGDYQSLIVGGAVRDYLLGIEPPDIDIATNCPLSIIENLFPTYDLGKSKDFGIIGIKCNNYTFEVANFRTEHGTDDGRHPKEIKIAKTFKEDSERRDFTINSMGMDKDKNIIDYHNGQEDLKNKIIRFVGNANIIIQEDYFRMLRAVRFSAKLGFEIGAGDTLEILKFSKKINSISVERIWQEIYKMTSNKTFDKAMNILLYQGLLSEIFPELVKLIYYFHDIKKHPERFGNVLGHVEETIKVANTDNPLVNLACLFHDIGKADAYTLDEEGIPHFNGHDEVGVEIFDKIADRLKIDNYTRDVINFCIKNHMRFHLFHEMKMSKIARLVSHEYFPILFEVTKADEFSRGDLNKDRWNIVLEKIEKAKNNKYFNVIEKKQDIISGDYIMKVLNIKPGKIIGHLKEMINNLLIDGEISIEEVDNELCGYFNELMERMYD